MFAPKAPHKGRHKSSLEIASYPWGPSIPGDEDQSHRSWWWNITQHKRWNSPRESGKKKRKRKPELDPQGPQMLQLSHTDYKISALKMFTGASLVMQWLRICLAMQGTRVWALVWEDPTCRGATKPVSHNYWACVSGACAPKRERPWQWEARAPRWRVAPARRNWRKPSHRNEDPTQQKNIYI